MKSNQNVINPEVSVNLNFESKSNWKLIEFLPSIIYGTALILQMILIFFIYNYYHLDLLAWFGWISFIVFLIIGALPRQAFLKYGEVIEGKNHYYTTKLVNKGIYGIIRHPYWLCWILLSIALTFMSQHPIMVILSCFACPIIYMETFQLDNAAIKKFGNDYNDYKKMVPRMNIILGLIKYSRRR